MKYDIILQNSKLVLFKSLLNNSKDDFESNKKDLDYFWTTSPKQSLPIHNI